MYVNLFQMKKITFFCGFIGVVLGQLPFPPLPTLPGLPPPLSLLANLPNLTNLPSPGRIVELLPEPSRISEIFNMTSFPSPQTIIENIMNFTPSNLPGLPTPQSFLETILNVTTGELNDLVSDFNFDEIPTKDVKFTLFLNETGIVLDANNMNVVKIDKPMKFLVHGWGVEDKLFNNLTESYHAIGITNVIGIDWSEQSKKSYLHAARSCKKVGEIVGDFILTLVKNNTDLLKNVHLIGHSLGAHMFGFTGKYINKMTNGSSVGRITALDAAGPLFEFPLRMPEDRRLSRRDADFIDSIHTNVGFFGFLSPFAHADFYVNNGGPLQPRCMNINMLEALACSHSKSVDLYAKTIISKEYLATSCENPLRAIANFCNDKPKVIMGEHAKSRDKGEFLILIDTDDKPTDRLF